MRAVGAPQAAADLADGFGGDRVDGAGGAVDVPDDGAGQVEGAGDASGFGAFGQVGAHREWVGGHRGHAPFGAPALPLAPDDVAEPPGAVGAGSGEGLTDAGGIPRA